MKYAIAVEIEGQIEDKITIDRFAVRAVSANHALRKAYQIMLDRQLNGQTLREIPVYRMTFTADKDCPEDLPVITW